MSEHSPVEHYRQPASDHVSYGVRTAFNVDDRHHQQNAVFDEGPSESRGLAASITTAVILAVASPTLLCGLESLVLSTRGLRLAGSTHTLPGLQSHLQGRGHAVALIDPFIAGHEGVRKVIDATRAASPHIRCVLISDEHQPHLMREAVKAGTNGFVGASAGAQEIQTALLEAAQGRRYISPAAASRLAESLTLEDLTSREMEVLTLLARGSCNKTIARSLDVSVGTVKTHVRSIMHKLSAKSRTEAVLKACRFGLVGLHS